MGSIYCAAPADVAWDYLDRFTRAEVLPFSSCVAGRLDGERRVVTMSGGHEVWERNVTVDPVRRRTSYTITGLNWVTDYLPHELAGQRAAGYAALFDELVAAVNAHEAKAVQS